MEQTKAPKSDDVVFDGLGGHSKLDDNFVVPKRTPTLKRYKSMSKVSSGKVKKLAPLPVKNSKGLESFINLLTDDDDDVH